MDSLGTVSYIWVGLYTYRFAHGPWSVRCTSLIKNGAIAYRPIGSRDSWESMELPWVLRSVTTKRSPLGSHGHKGECPIGEEAYKILYPLDGRPTPSGCTSIDQTEERDPSNIALYG